MKRQQATTGPDFRNFSLATLAAAAACFAAPAYAVVPVDAAARNTSAPAGTADDAWNLQGQLGSFLGTPIAPNLFIAARHIDSPSADGLSGRTFTHGSSTYTTVNSYNIAGTDLRVHQIGSNAFTNYATLYDPSTSGSEVGRSLLVFGRGTQRGADYLVDSTLRGWSWGTSDSVQSWGQSTVGSIVSSSTLGDFLTFNFANPGGIALTGGDSSGGLFVLVDGEWQLAGINYGVDGQWSRTNAPGSYTQASLFDARGLYVGSEAENELVPDGPTAIPGNSYVSRLASSREQINAIFAITGNENLIPEPASLAVVAAAMLLASRRRR